MPSPTAGEQWILVRFHGHPMGVVTLSRGCGQAELKERALAACSANVMRHIVEDDLWNGSRGEIGRLPWEVSTACPRTPKDTDLLPLTIAVCTRNRTASLARCLESLLALDYPSLLLDILVVDNAPSDDATEELVRGRFATCRYLREPRPGLNWARNRAIIEAHGDIIAFADDDVMVDRGWARAAASVFVRETNAMAVTGLVLPAEMDVPSQTLFERYGGFARGFDRRYYQIDRLASRAVAWEHGGTGRCGTGANMAFRRSVFRDIGLFDPALDVGTPTNGGGDLEMFFRIIDHGHLLVYEPTAIVFHRHRRTYSELRQQIENNGIGFYSYLVRTATASPGVRRDVVRLGLWWLWWWNVRRLLMSFIRPPVVPRDLIVAELLGSLRGLTRYRRAQATLAHVDDRFGPQLHVSSEQHAA